MNKQMWVSSHAEEKERSSHLTNALSIDDEVIPLPVPDKSFGSKKIVHEHQTSSNLEQESKLTTEYLNGGSKRCTQSQNEIVCDGNAHVISPNIADDSNSLEVQLTHKVIPNQYSMPYGRDNGRVGDPSGKLLNNSVINRPNAHGGENTFILDQQYTFANLPAECSPSLSKNSYLENFQSETNEGY